MKITKILAALILLAASPRAALACGELTGLEQVLVNSGIPVSQLAVAAANRLGYGVAQGGAYNPERFARVEASQGRAAAAELLAAHVRASLQNSARVHAPSMALAEQLYPQTWSLDISQKWDRMQYLGTLPPIGGHPQSQLYRNELIKAHKARKFLSAVLVPGLNAGEVLGDFWFNHFNTSNKANLRVAVFNADYELRLRRKACATFREMLVASASHPAMIQYLDNVRNVGGAINENYGREVIELHTLGTGPIAQLADGGTAQVYTQAEVFEAARVLSGWTYEAPRSGTVRFAFDSDGHDSGTKSFPMLFRSVTGGAATFGPGYNEALRFLGLLARHPRTKHNVCRKLVRHLVGGGGGAETRQRCVAAYGEEGNLPAMYEAILLTPEFWTSIQRGFKTPLELTASAHRALGFQAREDLVANEEFLAAFERTLGTMGWTQFGYGPPTGYPSGSYWATSSYLGSLLKGSFTASRHVLPVHEGLEGAALEAHVSSLAAPHEQVDMVMKKIFPVTYGLGGTSIERQLREALAAGKADRVHGAPAPARTIVTNVIGSSHFIRK